MMKKKLFICLLCFCLGVGVYQMLPRETYIRADASTAFMSLEEMVCKSDLILTGTVGTSEESQWDTSKTGEKLHKIHTDVNIAPAQIIQGGQAAKQSIQVRTQVGEIGNTIQTTSSYPTLEQGETVLLFLTETENHTEPYAILGSWQGKFVLTEEEGIPVYTNGRDTIASDKLDKTISEILDTHAGTQWESDYYTPEEIEKMNNALFHTDE